MLESNSSSKGEGESGTADINNVSLKETDASADPVAKVVDNDNGGIELKDIELGKESESKETENKAKTESKFMVGASARLGGIKKISLGWEKLSFTVKDRNSKSRADKVILQETSGFLEPGSMLSIMGPSGSGKSTFLESLANRAVKSKIGGKVLFNGDELTDKQRMSVLSFVAQIDSLMGQFTVWETVWFAARFFYGFGVSKKELDETVKNAIASMGLSHVKSTIVGDIFRKGISGGQMKRLSICIELVSHPSFLLLDEPTSGLDSASAYNVVKYLKNLCSHGQTVIMTIHQPSSELWQSFDKFMLLSEGRTLYFGNASDAIPYFAALGHPCPQYTNPADFLIHLTNKDFEDDEAVNLEELEQKYKESVQQSEIGNMISNVKSTKSDATDYERSNKHLKKCSFFVDFVVLSKRNILNNIRNPGIYWVRFAMYVMLSLMIGLMYLNLEDETSQTSVNSRISALFYVAAFLVFMAVAVLPFFIQERAVFLRERANGAYGTMAYVTSVYICSLPGLFIIALFSTICVVLLSGMHGFSTYLLCLFLCLVTAEAFMSLISAIVPHYIIGIALGAGVFGLFMLCQGFFIVRDDIPPGFIWVYYIAFHTYAFRVFMQNEFEPIKKLDGPPFNNGMDVLKFYDMEEINIERDLAVVFAFGVFFQIIFGLILFFFHKGKR